MAPPGPARRDPTLLWGKTLPGPHRPTPGHLRARLPGPGKALAPPGGGSAQSTLHRGLENRAVSGLGVQGRWSRGTTGACSGGPCVRGRSSLATSSISLWQKRSLYIVFKGGFCLRNLSEHACGVMLGRGCRNGSPSHPGLDLQRPPQLLSEPEPWEGVPAASAAPPAPPGATLYHPLWV